MYITKQLLGVKMISYETVKQIPKRSMPKECVRRSSLGSSHGKQWRSRSTEYYAQNRQLLIRTPLGDIVQPILSELEFDRLITLSLQTKEVDQK